MKAKMASNIAGRGKEGAILAYGSLFDVSARTNTRSARKIPIRSSITMAAYQFCKMLGSSELIFLRPYKTLSSISLVSKKKHGVEKLYLKKINV